MVNWRVFLALVCLCWTSAASAGWDLLDADGTRTLLQDGKLRSIHKADTSISIIYDGRKGVITAVYPAEKLYGTGTAEEFCGAVESLQRRIFDAMAPEEREMMEQYLAEVAAGAQPEVRIEEGESTKIAGITARHYRISVDGELYREVWLSRELLGSADDAERLMGLTQTISQCTASGFGAVGPVPETTDAFKALMRKGWALKSIAADEEHTGGVLTEIVEAKRRDIPEAEFAPPPGFRKASFIHMLETEMIGG